VDGGTTMMLRYEDRLPGVLIVDSDPASRIALASEMERQGWQVWTAANGEQAVKEYEREGDRIDVALVDLQLPGLLGVRVLSELAEINPDLPTCAMSANVSPYAASAFRRMSATPLFTKPMDIRALSFILHEMIAPVGKR
jgi:DNA-binding NtrC family response regulator